MLREWHSDYHTPSTMCVNSSEGLSIYVNGSPIEANVQNQTYILRTYFDGINLNNWHGAKLSNHISWIESNVWPCGQRQVKHKSHITNGQPTNHGDYPWHVALYRMEGGRQNRLKYICGGTIINNRTVLTAAHCVMNEYGVLPANRLFIVAGIHDLTKHTIDTQNYVVQAVTVHKDYNREYLENDIALLKLSGSIDFTNYIRPICIGQNSCVNNMTMGIVAGWGHDEHSQPSDVLLQAMLPIRTNAECRHSNRVFFHTYLNDYNYCAGYDNGTNVCSGDSGGGMIFEHNSRWYIRGIVSVGPALPNSNQCDITQMVIFTDVSKFFDWITSNLNDNL